ncbi:UPF0271 protein [Gluconobacter cerinus]|uniref:LamB/YcsF family protein n=1 Tax=Gluconobacter cerinus TaxID=38307 RepID=UPI0022263BBC|nr:5-oxoprolinase subunit PxpA [Gluconobacter cerinus]MCW2266738.1 UPF0271 protein [Gluconobacter cerinus]
MKIDLNSDLGEGYGRWKVADDNGLLDVISSANIACGFHAGDPSIMDHTVRMAVERGVGIGAHPGFPDLTGFGRRFMQLSPKEMEAILAYQIGALQGVASRYGSRVTHVSYHAAFGNAINADEALAERLAKVIATMDRNLIFFSMPDQPVGRAAEKAGLRVLPIFLADRAYDVKGNLVPRGRESAVIHDHAQLRDRVRQFLDSGTITTIEGETRQIKASSILVHSDTPGSVELARVIRSEIESGGGEIVPAHVLLG